MRQTAPTQQSQRQPAPFASGRAGDWALGWGGAAALLVIFAVVGITSVSTKNNTYDESAYVAAAVNVWNNHDFRLFSESGLLPLRLFGLPLAPMKLQLTASPQQWSEASYYAIGHTLLFKSGYDADQIILRARVMNLLLATGLGAAVYAWGRSLFGRGGAMLALLAYVVNPTILANGSLATTDLPAAAFFFVSVGAWWAMMQRLTLLRFLGSTLALAGVLLAKPSAPLVLPMGLILLLIRVAAARPLPVGWRAGSIRREVCGRAARLATLLGAMAAQGVLTFIIIWAAYEFRYSAFGPAVPGRPGFYCSWDYVFGGSGQLAPALTFLRDHKVLPEAYVFGLAFTLARAQIRSSFLNGYYSNYGIRGFFPYAMLVKTPLALFALLLLSAAATVRRWPRPIGRIAWNGFYATAPFWVLLLVYGWAALTSKLNIGQRHLLPLYPVLTLFAGGAAAWLAPGARRAARLAVGVVVLLLVLDAALVYPNYLAYFNAIAGGPANGYKRLVDSSLDWGQDLRNLGRWLRDNNLGGPGQPAVYHSYFGTAEPRYYKVPGTDIRNAELQVSADTLGPGCYCVSATDLAAIYTTARGHWCAAYETQYQQAKADLALLTGAGPEARARMIRSMGENALRQRGAAAPQQEFAGSGAARQAELADAAGVREVQALSGTFLAMRYGRLMAYLRQREPDANVGYSILIFRLSADDVKAALEGPPPELAPDPDTPPDVR